MTSIAIRGAGPRLGLAIARTFGSQGFGVALISRKRGKRDSLVGKLTAAALPADVLDRDALTRALQDAAARFGGIGVLEYSPAGTVDTTALTAPTGTEPSHVEFIVQAVELKTRAMRELSAKAVPEAEAGSGEPQTAQRHRCRSPRRSASRRPRYFPGSRFPRRIDPHR
jgi:NAD(P)-dependent dehydrogenase (short-subunit alcohol dehydrogenase family)